MRRPSVSGMRAAPLFAAALATLLCIRCGNTPVEVAGTTNTGNAMVSGRVVDINGHGAIARVLLIPSNFNPLASTVAPASVQTGAEGSFAFPEVPPGSYNIEALHLLEHTKALTPVRVNAGDTLSLSQDTLRRTGAVRVLLHKPVDTLNGYLYVPGTTLLMRLNRGALDSGYVEIDSAPAGLLPPLTYAVMGDTAKPVAFAWNLTADPDRVVVADWGRVLSVERAASPPSIDGELAEWSGVTPFTLTDTSDGTTCSIRILWDDSSLYIASEVRDEHLNVHTAYHGEDMINMDDAVEFMVNLDGVRGSRLDSNDYKFYVNVLGRRADTRGADSMNHSDTLWNSLWITAIRYRGTVNDNRDTDTGYTVEIAVPWRAMTTRPPSSGDKVGFDIVMDNRYDSIDWNQFPWANHRVMPDFTWINIPDEWGELILR